jgi:hypothetical protein
MATHNYRSIPAQGAPGLYKQAIMASIPASVNRWKLHILGLQFGVGLQDLLRGFASGTRLRHHPDREGKILAECACRIEVFVV